MQPIMTFNTFSEFKSFDFTDFEDIQKVLTNSHTISGIGAAEYSRAGTGLADTGNEAELSTSDGSIWKLTSFPVSAEHFGALPRAHGSSSMSINKFLVHISENDVGSASFAGDYGLDEPIQLGVNATGDNVRKVATKQILGSPKLVATAPMEVVFYIRNFIFSIWNGKIHIFGSNDSRWTEPMRWKDRTTLYGVVVSGCGRSSFDGFFCNNVSVYGLLCTSESEGGGNVTFINVGDCRFLGCGSGTGNNDDNYFMTSTWSNRREEGTSGSGGQRTVIDVVEIPSEAHLRALTYPFIQLENGELHFVWDVDRRSNTIKVYPWIDTTLHEGSFRWVFGGGMGLRGSDANVINASGIDATTCASGLDMMSIYGPTVQRLVSQNNFTGMRFGLRPNGAMVSANIGAFYTEGSTSAFIPVVTGRNDGAYHIATEYALNLGTQVQYLKVRYGDNRTTHNGLFGYTILMNGDLLTYEKKPNNRATRHSRLDLTINNKDISQVYRIDKWNIQLNIDMAVHSAFGYDSAQLTMLGSGTNFTPTGGFTFKCKDSSATVNSAESWIAKEFTGPAIFTIYYEVKDNNYIVAVTNKLF